MRFHHVQKAAVAAIIVFTMSLIGAPSSADVWITDGTNTALNQYRNDGTLVRAVNDVGGEGIYDLARGAGDQSIWTATNILGTASLFRHDIAANTTVNRPNSFPEPVVSVATSGGPIAVAASGDVIIGANQIFAQSPLGPTVKPQSLLRFGEAGDWSILAPPVASQTSPYKELKFSPAGQLYASRVDGTLQRFDADSGALVATIATNAVDFSFSSTGALALLNAQRDVVQIDALTGAVGPTLLSHTAIAAAIGNNSIGNMVFGPNDGLLMTATSTTPKTVNTFLFDPAAGTSRLFASTYSLFNVPSIVEYTTPEPTTAVAMVLAILARPCRRR